MNDLIVVAGATHREGFIDEYESQLRNAGVDFHLEPLFDLPAGANSITMQRRIDYIRKVCEKFVSYDKVVMTDAWDVLFYGTKEEVLSKIPGTMIVSAERNCYPEPHLAPHFQSSSPWRFANNGMLAGSPAYMLEWCDRALNEGDLAILDQAWFNRRCATGSDLVHLDETTDLFYVVSATQEDGSLQMRDGRPVNAASGKFPNFFHFSGKCPDFWFRKLWTGEISALY